MCLSEAYAHVNCNTSDSIILPCFTYMQVTLVNCSVINRTKNLILLPWSITSDTLWSYKLAITRLFVDLMMYRIRAGLYNVGKSPLIE